MSEHLNDVTPTTEEVKASWVKGGAFWDARGHEFDRWLAKHDDKIRAQAWDSGYHSGYDDGRYGVPTKARRRNE